MHQQFEGLRSAAHGGVWDGPAMSIYSKGRGNSEIVVGLHNLWSKSDGIHLL